MQAVWCVRVCGVCKPSVCVCVCKPGVLCVCGVCLCVCVGGCARRVCVGRGYADRVV